MKQRLTTFSQHYVAALCTHLQSGNGANLQPAQGLGRQAVVLGLETLGLAQMHAQALGRALLPAKSARTRATATRRAENFFNAANTLIEETHLTARQGKIKLDCVNRSLTERTSELAASNRQVQRGAVRHKVMENSFAKTNVRHGKCLEESLELQKRLRQLTHRVIATQEDERKKISCELQDEIAQTLLGINIRLLSLKQGDQNNTKSLKHEIASTQRLVVKSVKSVQRYARKLEGNPPA